MFIFSVVAIEVWDTQMPVWALVLGLLLCTSASSIFLCRNSLEKPSAFVYTIPVGMIQAITNQQIGLKYVVGSQGSLFRVLTIVQRVR